MQIIETPRDICYLCGNDFKHYKVIKTSKDYGMKEIEFVTEHKSCRKLIKKRNKLMADLLDVDYDIYIKQIMD